MAISQPIEWQALPQWVPGETLRSSEGLNWQGVGLRSYRFKGQCVQVPELRDFMLASNDGTPLPLRRNVGGGWQDAVLDRGATALLSAASASEWDWNQTANVTHLYLSNDMVQSIAEEVTDGKDGAPRLRDVICSTDPFVRQVIQTLADEVTNGGENGALYVDAMARSLLHYVLVMFRSDTVFEKPPDGLLSPPMRRHITDFIECHLTVTLTLEDMAREVGLPAWGFARRFKKSFGAPPYAYVQNRRIEKASTLLRHTSLSISDIAVLCGFSDQAHLTRLFRRAFDIPPGEFRRQSTL
ncbi:hypothetical protein GCM10007385_41300 [Tateyamaria omphalii]|uniref:helix-turn-helix domain-containing protein n=1 Tax=Tateyamaria omphalii TaxID=299262 RepID=UPI0016753B7B|nr:AraC family transcriptional regulator [Tateyamaria omphalii]GGX67834.1 hypothetical protein GCM10007385_41300 [Tateyamaria omphalii]